MEIVPISIGVLGLFALVFYDRVTGKCQTVLQDRAIVAYSILALFVAAGFLQMQNYNSENRRRDRGLALAADVKLCDAGNNRTLGIRGVLELARSSPAASSGTPEEQARRRELSIQFYNRALDLLPILDCSLAALSRSNGPPITVVPSTLFPVPTVPE